MCMRVVLSQTRMAYWLWLPVDKALRRPQEFLVHCSMRFELSGPVSSHFCLPHCRSAFLGGSSVFVATHLSTHAAEHLLNLEPWGSRILPAHPSR